MRVQVGGLFRCCIEHAQSTYGPEGARNECPKCGSQMVCRDGAWEWVRP